MKKLIGLAVSLIFMMNFAYGEFHNPNKKQGGKQNMDTVKAAKKASDDSNVTLEGNIIKKVKDETYLFRDKTGEIQVEIDEEIWQGREVTPSKKVKIKGEVDKDNNQPTKIDVKLLKAGSGNKEKSSNL